MPTDALELDNRDARLEEVLLEYVEASERGQAPDRETWTAKYPEFTTEIAEYFAGLDRVEPLAKPLRAVAEAMSHGSCVLLNTHIDSSPAAPSLRGQFGNYALLEEIGRGGMGIVYKARQRDPERLVALKIIRAGAFASPAEIRRFRDEAGVIAHLEHPHIVPIYEVGEASAPEGGAPITYFSMRLIEGGSLAQRLPEFAKDPRSAARVTATIAEAVHYAHQRGVLHRDLKPANILIGNRQQATGNSENHGGASSLLADASCLLPVVTDFGLAKRLDAGDDATLSGVLVGTPSYMAPEQAAGTRGPISTATDVYGLGAILYALLTGHPPFHGLSVLETLELLQNSEPVWPRARNPLIDADLETICLKCLAKEPGRRYASAAAVADDLRRYLSSEPIQARPVGWGERLWLWSRRRPLVAGLAAALALSLIAGIGLIIWQWQRAETYAAQVEQQRAVADASFRHAHEAVNNLMTKAIELRDVPGMQPAEKELLKAALAYYEVFLRERGQDPALRAEMAATLQRVGEITGAIGSKTEALAAFQQARDMYMALLTIDSGNKVLRTGLAHTYNMMGLLQANLGQAGAADSYGHARALLTELNREHPAAGSYQFDLAAVLANLGNLHRSEGRLADARACFTEANERMAKLAGEQPGNPTYLSGLAGSSINLGALQLSTGNAAEGQAAYEKARDVLEKGVQTYPGKRDLQFRLASVYKQLASHATAANHNDEAIASLQKGQVLLEKLVRANPSVTSYIRELAAVHRQMGHALFNSGQREAALDRYRQGRDLLTPIVRPEESNLDLANDLAKCWFDMGALQSPEEGLESLEQAIELRSKLLEAHPNNAGLRYDCGLTFYNRAMAMWKLGRREEAIASLRKAVEQQGAASARAPGVTDYRRALNGSRAKLAEMLQSLGRADEADAVRREMEK
jgi:serine/threonine protein kinase/tetratricopeptide (TPR) repeat protein